jgi:hypothetical protein
MRLKRAYFTMARRENNYPTLGGLIYVRSLSFIFCRAVKAALFIVTLKGCSLTGIFIVALPYKREMTQ